MRITRFTLAGAALLLFSLGACTDDSDSPAAPSAPSLASARSSTNSYLILGRGNKLPPGLAAKIKAAGGTLTGTIGKVGVAVATAKSANFKAKASAIPGIEAVALDRAVRWIPPKERRVRARKLARPFGVRNASIGDDETFFGFQWNMFAINAPGAWDAGARGTGVRVAVIDGGINPDHIDLVGRVDLARSASFVPGFAFNQDVDPDDFSHSTHVSGIIAANDNGIGTIGVAPGATIVAVKVLHEGTGTFGAVIQGIVYAALPISQGGGGADIINMSLGAEFFRAGVEAAQLASALSRATTFAYQQGVVVIASAGNSAFDLDHTANLISVPAQSANVLAIAATGPVNFAGGGSNFTRPASYTNFGQSAIDFGAPGGDFTLFPNGLWFLDMVLSPGTLTDDGGYFFGAGTSQAAPHAAGVAALIIEEFGRRHPAQTIARLRRSSDDLGKVGNDDFYGKGFVNAFRAATGQ